jgi:hypothetical protein
MFPVLLAALMALVGWLLASLISPRGGFLERVAYALLFTLSVVPLVAYNLALALPAFVSSGLLAAVAGAFLLGLAWPAWRLGRGLLPPAPQRGELALLALALALGALTWLHHNDSELWLSLGSYLQTDKAKCFYMQTFSFVPELNQGRDPEMVRRAYGIISTPGNSLFTAGWMQVMGPWAFRFLQSAFHALLFLFGVLLLRRWTGSLLVAVVASCFAVLNPYTLWIEVLDRNLYVYALSPALLYTLTAHRERALAHGLLLGLIGGLGLRFLPLLFLAPVALLYLRWRQPLRRWGLLALGVVLAFAFELPHLQHHGFHSMGEQAALPALLAGLRTPMLPFDNASYYMLFMLAQLGWMVGAVALYGAWVCLRERPVRAVALALMVLLPLLVLAGQRDWIEYDKTRIFIMSLWSVITFFAFGLRELTHRAGWGRRAVGLAVALTLVVALDLGLRVADRPSDPTSHVRKPVYQAETPAYLDLLRSAFARSGPLPEYGHLADKLRWRHKGTKARMVLATMVAGQESPWVERWLDEDDGVPPRPLGPPEGEEAWLDLAIDLELLVADPHAAVSVGPTKGRVMVDYSKPERVFDIHHKQVEVSWQAEPLPVTVLAQRPDIGVLRELYLDLNAFVSLEEDELGFQKVNLVQYALFPEQRERGLATAMTALPWMNPESVVRVRIPADMRVVVRNWLVNPSEAVPHRIDAWFVEVEDRQPQVRFHFGEPESYL